MNNYLIWLCCNRVGRYRVYKQKPNRDTTSGVWKGDYDAKGMVALAYLESIGFSLPELSWESEPVKLEISLKWEDQGR